MKKLLTVLLSLLLVLTVAGCQNKETSTVDEPEEIDEVKEEEEVLPMPTMQSDDKHIAYIANYVGKNCASIGYTAMSGDRNDYLGDAYLHLIYETVDGTYVDLEDEEILKQYVVVSQSFGPNTETKLGFAVDSEGEEYSFTNWQSVEEIVLQVKKIGEDVKFEHEPVKVNQSIDRYTFFMPDFVGRNLMTCGYISMGGDLRFRLGEANVKINIVTADGSYVDIDAEVLKNYVVYAQSVEPNSEFKIQFEVDSEGNEYDNLVDQQSYKEIDLYVKAVK